MTLEESREVIPMMETMINRIEEQQNLMEEILEREIEQQKQGQEYRSIADKIKANRET